MLPTILQCMPLILSATRASPRPPTLQSTTPLPPSPASSEQCDALPACSCASEWPQRGLALQLTLSPSPTLPRSFPSATNQTTITITFEASDAGSGLANITCRFRQLNPAQSNASATSQDAAESASEWRPCTSPQNYTGLQEGRYGLTLRAADRAGMVKQVGLGWRPT